MKNSREYVGQVTEGKLPDLMRKAIAVLLKSLDGQKIKITIAPYKKRRSNDQNRYYFKMLDDYVLPVYREYGSNWSVWDVHEHIVKELGYVEVYFDPQGKPFPRRKHTSEFTTEEFSEYLERFWEYCATELKLYIPSPNAFLNEEFGLEELGQ